MKFIALATVLAATIAVASASLPVQPESFVLSQEDQHQHIINHKPVFSR
jgi:hypothetical protein